MCVNYLIPFLIFYTRLDDTKVMYLSGGARDDEVRHLTRALTGIIR